MVRLSLVFASALLFCLPLQAQEIPRPREGVINSSGSGQLKVVTYEVMNAQATVMMLLGGSWNIGRISYLNASGSFSQVCLKTKQNASERARGK